jgi:hypothetical protein
LCQSACDQEDLFIKRGLGHETCVIILDEQVFSVVIL